MALQRCNGLIYEAVSKFLHIFITESGEVDPAVLADLEALVKDLSGCEEVHHTVAGCTVSSHCGPKTLGVLFIEQ